MNNLNNINFNEKIENYVSSGKSLHVSRRIMRKILYSSIVFNKKIFEEIGYDSYKPKEQFNIKHKDICNFIEECIRILVKKQQIMIS